MVRNISELLTINTRRYDITDMTLGIIVFYSYYSNANCANKVGAATRVGGTSTTEYRSPVLP